jgi:uroporphyrinogen-III synthase
VSIGPVTSAEAERQGLSVVAEAETHDLDGLVEAVKLAASRAGSSPS